jgi:hypothetical protein
LHRWTCTSIHQFLSTTATELAIKVMAAIAFWIMGRWLIGRVVALIQAAMNRNQVDPTLTKYLGNIVAIALNIALVLGILGYFGIQTTSFAAMLAGAGVAIGAAWSGLLGNFAAGAFMLVLRPFKVGDFVSIGGVTGTVHELGLFGTTIITPDNVMTIVGNGKVFGDTIQNFSVLPERRVERVAQLAAASTRWTPSPASRRPSRRSPTSPPDPAAGGQPARHQAWKARSDRRAALHPHRPLLAGVLRHQRGHRARVQGSRLAAGSNRRPEPPGGQRRSFRRPRRSCP